MVVFLRWAKYWAKPKWVPVKDNWRAKLDLFTFIIIWGRKIKQLITFCVVYVNRPPLSQNVWSTWCPDGYHRSRWKSGRLIDTHPSTVYCIFLRGDPQRLWMPHVGALVLRSGSYEAQYAPASTPSRLPRLRAVKWLLLRRYASSKRQNNLWRFVHSKFFIFSTLNWKNNSIKKEIKLNPNLAMRNNYIVQQPNEELENFTRTQIRMIVEKYFYPHCTWTKKMMIDGDVCNLATDRVGGQLHSMTQFIGTTYYCSNKILTVY